MLGYLDKLVDGEIDGDIPIEENKLVAVGELIDGEGLGEIDGVLTIFEAFFETIIEDATGATIAELPFGETLLIEPPNKTLSKLTLLPKIDVADCL